MYKLRYLPVARQDLLSTVAYISGELSNPEAAEAFISALEQAVLPLMEYPYSHPLYRAMRPLETEYRMLPVKSYLVFYTVLEAENVVEIHRVIYAKMDISRLLCVK